MKWFVWKVATTTYITLCLWMSYMYVVAWEAAVWRVYRNIRWQDDVLWYESIQTFDESFKWNELCTAYTHTIGLHTCCSKGQRSMCLCCYWFRWVVHRFITAHKKSVTVINLLYSLFSISYKNCEKFMIRNEKYFFLHVWIAPKCSVYNYTNIREPLCNVLHSGSYLSISFFLFWFVCHSCFFFDFFVFFFFSLPGFFFLSFFTFAAFSPLLPADSGSSACCSTKASSLSSSESVT